jgi:tetratricopeptide (TPR) repeat protein
MHQGAAWLEEGLALHNAGRLAAAAASYRAGLAAAPDHADARHLLGLALHQAGDSAGALRHLARAAALRPDVALFQANLGIARLAAGDPAGAEAALRRADRLAPHDADTLHNLGLALLRLGRPAEAADMLGACLALDPTAVDARINLGAALHACGRAAEAAAMLRAALAARPCSIPALASLAEALGPTAEAEDCLRLAYRLAPSRPDLAARLGNLLRERGRLAESATLLAPLTAGDEPDALHNLALTVAAQGAPDAAEALLDRALAADPAHADAAYARGTTRLLAGRLRAGWDGFERRWSRSGFTEPWRYAAPRWRGEPGGTLLLHAEQGLGDTLQMLRFVPSLAARRRVVLAVPATLLRLCRGLAPVVTTPDALPAFDRHCPLMSLPHVLDVGPEDLPGPMPYLRGDPAPWRARLAALPGRRIGICWSGNPAYPADHRRSLPAASLAGLARPGLHLVSLQKDAPAPPGVTDWTAELADMADTAGLIAALDLVISVDTAVAHLAGALGRPVWLLNRHAPCWRWQLGREDSPWYPTLRQFRQPAPGDWGTVMAEVARALA